MKDLFVDTSAFYALLDRSDDFHERARDFFSTLNPEEINLVCSSYVVLETLSLLQNRIGLEPVRSWRSELQPLLEVVWMDSRLHEKALTALVASGRREISLTDWSSFELMRERGIQEVFAFDPHFSEQGFHLLPQAS